MTHLSARHPSACDDAPPLASAPPPSPPPPSIVASLASSGGGKEKGKTAARVALSKGASVTNRWHGNPAATLRRPKDLLPLQPWPSLLKPLPKPQTLILLSHPPRNCAPHCCSGELTTDSSAGRPCEHGPVNPCDLGRLVLSVFQRLRFIVRGPTWRGVRCSLVRVKRTT